METPETYLQSHEGLQIIRGLRPEGIRVKTKNVMRKELITLSAPGSDRKRAKILQTLYAYWDFMIV